MPTWSRYDEFLEVSTKPSDFFSAAVSINGPIPPLPFSPEGDDITDQLTRIASRCRDRSYLDMDGQTMLPTARFSAAAHPHEAQGHEEYIIGLIERMIDQLIDRGGCEIMKEFASPLTTMLVADLLGVPEGDRQDLVKALGLPPTQLGGDAEYKVQSDPLAWLFDRFYGYLVERREKPCGDFLSDLAQSTYKDGSKPDLAVLARLSCFMFGAGDTTARQMPSASACSATVLTFRRASAQIRRSSRSHRGSAAPGKPGEGHIANALKPHSVGGVPISAGSIVTKLWSGQIAIRSIFPIR